MFGTIFDYVLSQTEQIIKNGNAYILSFTWESVGDGTENNIAIYVPDINMHTHIEGCFVSTTASRASFQIYESAAISGGSEISGTNLNRYYATAFPGKVIRGPSVDSYGSPLFQPNKKIITGGTGDKKRQALGISEKTDIYCLQPDSYCLLSFTNDSGGTANIMKLAMILSLTRFN